MEKYKIYRHIEKEKPITRVVLFEKCRKHDFENFGLKYWYDKNGKVIRVDNENSTIDFGKISITGSTYLDTGYVFAPYIPAQLTPVISEFNSFVPKKTIQSRYAATKINTNYYGVVTL